MDLLHYFSADYVCLLWLSLASLEISLGNLKLVENISITTF